MIKSVPVTYTCLPALRRLGKIAASFLAAISIAILFFTAPANAQKNPEGLTELNGTLIFNAYSFEYGTELWRSDGTPAGTLLLKDITPGAADSEFYSNHKPVRSGSNVYFIVKRNELWKTDGTAAGTVMVKGFTSPILNHNIDGLTDVNGTLYFVFDKGAGQFELWKSNGTEAGTTALKTFVRPNDYNIGSLGIENMVNANGVLYFVGHDATHGLELWKSNGTTEGTVLVKDIWPGSNSSSPAYLAYWNGNVYFGAKDGSMAGRELWKSNGTSAGTVLVKDNAPSNPNYFTVSKGMLFFIAESDPSKPYHHSLWKTDGTAQGTVSISPQSTAAYVGMLRDINGTLFFNSDKIEAIGMGSANRRILWKSDGTTAGTVIVKEFSPKNEIAEMVNLNGVLFFSFSVYENDSDYNQYDRELWKSDGTQAGTVIVKDINPGKAYGQYPIGSRPKDLRVVNGSLFFSANDGTSNGRHLWKSNGTEAGTVKLTTACTATGTILREYWPNVTGSTVASIPVNTWPTTSTQLTSFEAPTNVADNYGQRVRGYLCAPATGSYTFYIASDNDSELYLSADDDPATKVKIASISGWTASREWTKYPSQKSATITLEQGRKYYIEALHKENMNGDNLAVAWQTPTSSTITIIPGSVLSPSLPSGPVCSATGTILREYWPGVTGTAVSTIPVNTPPATSTQISSFEAPTNVGDNYGQRISGYICAPATGNYTFYIAADNEAELWLSADDNVAYKQKIAAVASSGSAWTAPREWTKYASQKSATVVLQAGKRYYIEALHKENMNGDNLAVGWQTPTSSAVTVIPGAVLSPSLPSGPVCSATGSILRDYWAGVPGNTLYGIPVNTLPTSSTQLSSFEAPSNVGDSYAQRIRGYICAPLTGSYTFYIASDDASELWLSTDDKRDNKVKIASISGWTAPRNWVKSSVITLEQGKKYYVEALHKEDHSGDHLAVGWTTPASASITVIPGSVLSPFVPISVQPPVVAITSPVEGVGYSLTTQVFPVKATASDPDGTISKVEFFEVYLGAQTKVGEDLTAPYEFVWTGMKSAVFLIAKATDNGGITTTSREVSLSSMALPSPWENTDIGAVARPGNAGYSNANKQFYLTSGGYDFWTAPDDFHFVFQRFQYIGDATIIAKIESIENTNKDALAGIMMRAGNSYVATVVNPSNTIQMSRQGSGTPAYKLAAGAGSAPKWLKLSRSGNALTSSYSSDGVSWTDIGTVNVNLGEDMFIGMANTSHDRTQWSTAVFSNVSITTAPACIASGTILREYWAGVSGTTVSIPANTPPTSTSQLTSFEAPTNVADNYAQRVRGYICPPSNGYYTFYIAADNEAELWLSTTDNPSYKQKIASVTSFGSGWTSPREWGKYSTQKSVEIFLVKGKKYYIEALHKENMNGDNLAVAWQTPTSSVITVIPGSALATFVPASAARLASGEEKQLLDLSVFPNPSSGENLQVQVQGMDSKQAVKLSLYNSVGTLIFSQAYESDEAGALAKELHLSGKVSSGIYLLKAESKGKTLVQRVVIHK